MRANFCLMLAYIGICKVVTAQDTLPTSDANFSLVDSTKMETMAMAPHQPRAIKVSSIISPQTAVYTTSPGSPGIKNLPVELNANYECSNPPGFMGYRKGDIILNQRKPISEKKWLRHKKNQCYPF